MIIWAIPETCTKKLLQVSGTKNLTVCQPY